MNKTRLLLAAGFLMIGSRSFAQEANGDAGLPATQPSVPAVTQAADGKDAARSAFERGLGHFDRSEWSAALAEFLRSRELFPTRSATKNAAICFRKEGRFDEALESYEALLREFPDLSPGDRTFAEREISELRASIGSIEVASAEPGAAIVLDGRPRGVYPSLGPLRVSAGSHMLRVFKEGYVPFEQRVEVAGRQLVTVDAKLGALTQSGRLSVTETTGKSVSVVVDNVVVGRTPWTGSLAVGGHTVLLKGEGAVGTQPASAVVRLGNTTSLSLAAELLTSTLRVTPVPAGATISIDGVSVGQGVWDGNLRPGLHQIEAAADGFLPIKNSPVLADGNRSALTLTLDRDPSSPLWRAKHPPRVYADLSVGPAIGLAFGGDVRDTCTGACSASVPLGFGATVQGGYEFSSGLTLGIDAGYLLLSSQVRGRSAELLPLGLAANPGALNHDLETRGVRFGGSAGFRFGEMWPIALRLGAGAVVGSAVDVRRGTFTNSGGEVYPVEVSESASVTHLYLAPEVRVSRRFESRLEVGVSLSFLALVALDLPKWTDARPVLAAPRGAQGDGIAKFGTQTLSGSVISVVVPSVGARYSF